MGLFNLKLEQPILKKYKDLIKNLLKYIVIILIFHLLINISAKNNKINFGFGGKLFNCDIMNTLCMFLLAYASYELVFKELVTIN